MFLQREICTYLDLLQSTCTEHVLQQQTNQKKHHDQHAKTRVFELGQTVMIRNYRGNPKWLTGVILKRSALLTYQVKTHSGFIWKIHVDQLCATSTSIIPNCQNNTNNVIDIPLLRKETSSSATADTPPQSTMTFAYCYPVRNCRPFDFYGVQNSTNYDFF